MLRRTYWNSAVDTSTTYAAIPDNQGRGQPRITRTRGLSIRSRMTSRLMNAPDGQFFVGESGTELVFRLVMNAALGTASNGQDLRINCWNIQQREALRTRKPISGKTYAFVPHDDARGLVTAADYALHNTDTVATIPSSVACHRHVGCVALLPETFVAPTVLSSSTASSMRRMGKSTSPAMISTGCVISPHKCFHVTDMGLLDFTARRLHYDNLVGGPPEAWSLAPVIPAPMRR